MQGPAAKPRQDLFLLSLIGSDQTSYPDKSPGTKKMHPACFAPAPPRRAVSFRTVTGFQDASSLPLLRLPESFRAASGRKDAPTRLHSTALARPRILTNRQVLKRCIQLASRPPHHGGLYLFGLSQASKMHPACLSFAYPNLSGPPVAGKMRQLAFTQRLWPDLVS